MRNNDSISKNVFKIAVYFFSIFVFLKITQMCLDYITKDNYQTNNMNQDNDANIGNENTENVNENYSGVITAYQISSDYESNEIAADLKYRDKVLRVSGVVDEISRSQSNKMLVSLEGYDYRIVIHCFFSEEHLNIISKLSKGQSIIIEGKCTGKNNYVDVFLKDCVIE